MCILIGNNSIAIETVDPSKKWLSLLLFISPSYKNNKKRYVPEGMAECNFHLSVYETIISFVTETHSEHARSHTPLLCLAFLEDDVMW